MLGIMPLNWFEDKSNICNDKVFLFCPPKIELKMFAIFPLNAFPLKSLKFQNINWLPIKCPPIELLCQNSYDKSIVSNLDMEFRWHQKIITVHKFIIFESKLKEFGCLVAYKCCKKSIWKFGIGPVKLLPWRSLPHATIPKFHSIVLISAGLWKTFVMCLQFVLKMSTSYNTPKVCHFFISKP